MESISLSAFLKGALTLTTALAWNTAAKESITSIYKTPESGGARAQIIYAVILTIGIIFIIFAYNYSSDKIKKVKGKNVDTENTKSAVNDNPFSAQMNSFSVSTAPLPTPATAPTNFLKHWDNDNFYVDGIKKFFA